jgi:hypothetical protein
MDAHMHSAALRLQATLERATQNGGIGQGALELDAKRAT